MRPDHSLTTETERLRRLDWYCVSIVLKQSITADTLETYCFIAVVAII